jgi:muramoyltetrapeptide carboxypeptidase
MQIPPSLRTQDKVAITCPAKKLPHEIGDAVRLLESWGLEVVPGQTVSASWNQFAGSDELRARDLQHFLDDLSVKAIFAARGGYGTVRIIDQVDFGVFAKAPKWIVGFSDITVLHSHIHTNAATATIHGQMPLTIPDATKPSLESLRKALFGEPLSYRLDPHPMNRYGTAKGMLTGGNLSLLMALSGSVSDIDTSGKILFLEDVGEYLYAIDRMLYHLDRAGKLEHLAGLIIGGFTSLKDNDVPFGMTVELIVKNIVDKYTYPVVFQFPAGHIDDNRALIFGQEATLSVTEGGVTLDFG